MVLLFCTIVGLIGNLIFVIALGIEVGNAATLALL
jgi:hypothetical protein